MANDDPRSRHLFRRFPGLVGKVPWMPLADLPTPVRRLPHMCDCLGVREFWIKRDDLNSKLYGGNKPRKFEFILAEAKAMGRKEVLTVGSAGSNHGAATSLFCHELGLGTTLAVAPQPVLSYVRENILVDAACGTQFLDGGNDVVSGAKAFGYWVKKRLQGEPPYFMYFGGSSILGNIGFVEAGLELASQIVAGEMPAPRYLFTATGSCGTHAGLLIGLKLAGVPTEVVGVRIVPKVVTNEYMVAWHVNRTVRFLRKLEPSFPDIRVAASNINLLHDFYGGQYGRPTPECKAAIRTLEMQENIRLDPTYTGKAFAGMLSFVKSRGVKHEPVVFWLTLNTNPLAGWAAKATPDQLPPPQRKYFEEPLYDPEL
jgi:D-cysteine desulfhydrase